MCEAILEFRIFTLFVLVESSLFAKHVNMYKESDYFLFPSVNLHTNRCCVSSKCRKEKIVIKQVL